MDYRALALVLDPRTLIEPEELFVPMRERFFRFPQLAEQTRRILRGHIARDGYLLAVLV